jgi:hypothetical protein
MNAMSRKRPWSKLQRELYALCSPDIDIQIHAVGYRMKTQRGQTGLARQWITLGTEIIWDYPHGWEEPAVSDVMREYIETPKDELFAKSFENDKWGLTDILRAADRRIGKRRLGELKLLNNPAVDKIVEARLKGVG